DRTQAILRAANVPTPEGWVIKNEKDLRALPLGKAKLRHPLIVKLTREDASIGISAQSVVHTRRDLEKRVRVLRSKYRQPILIERYIEGRELYVSLVGNGKPRAFPMHEIDFANLPAEHPRIVTYEGKWVTDSGGWRGTTPVRAKGLSARARKRCAEVA